MSGNEIRIAFINFMEERGHSIIPSASIVPENDPTTLFTGSGMQPLIPYLMGKEHPMGSRLVNSQRCFRAEDIDEIGDNRHTTFFEMLGNWSLGDYFKEEQITWFYSFLIDELKLKAERIYVTTFGGDENLHILKDTESSEIWQSAFKKQSVSNGIAHMGSVEDASKRGIKEGERIFFYDSTKNWWSRSGTPEKMPAGEIGGPDTEIFYDFGIPHDELYGEHCHPNCDCGRFFEIGNSVFIQYIKTPEGTFHALPKRNVDFGGGLERIAAASLDNPDMFMVDLLKNIILQIEQLSGKKYQDHMKAFRIIADHIRGAVFMISDDVMPSNTEQGYFTRRLLRRAIRYADIVGIPHGNLRFLGDSVINSYKEHYEQIEKNAEKTSDAIYNEEIQFRKTLELGLKEFNKIALKVSIPMIQKDGRTVPDTQKGAKSEKFITGENAFTLFTTYGFPIELTEEIAKERGMSVALDEFKALMDKHREQSRHGAENKFKAGLADHSKKTIMYHTVTHLLLAALRKNLGNTVHQAGSNITAERLRFDFTHDQKLDTKTISKIEEDVNHMIKTNAEIKIETIPKNIAKNDPTIEGSFWDRYPDMVNVYTISDENGKVHSRELCGGPHIKSTSEIKGTFKIIREESSAFGVRRVKGVITDN